MRKCARGKSTYRHDWDGHRWIEPAPTNVRSNAGQSRNRREAPPSVDSTGRLFVRQHFERCEAHARNAGVVSTAVSWTTRWGKASHASVRRIDCAPSAMARTRPGHARRPLPSPLILRNTLPRTRDAVDRPGVRPTTRDAARCGKASAAAARILRPAVGASANDSRRIRRLCVFHSMRPMRAVNRKPVRASRRTSITQHVKGQSWTTHRRLSSRS
jgi:hypothetical protein